MITNISNTKPTSVKKADLLAAAEAAVEGIEVKDDFEAARLAQAARLGALTAMRELRSAGIVLAA